jgi:hypothetical protein
MTGATPARGDAPRASRAWMVVAALVVAAVLAVVALIVRR